MCVRVCCLLLVLFIGAGLIAGGIVLIWMSGIHRLCEDMGLGTSDTCHIGLTSCFGQCYCTGPGIPSFECRPIPETTSSSPSPTLVAGGILCIAVGVVVIMVGLICMCCCRGKRCCRRRGDDNGRGKYDQK